MGGDANDSLELDEILARWKEAVEQCMSRDKLRISDVFRRFDKDADGRLSLEVGQDAVTYFIRVLLYQ